MREVLLKLFEKKDFVSEEEAKELLGEDFKLLLNTLLKNGLVRVDVSAGSCSDFPETYYFLTPKGMSLIKADKSSK